MKKNKWEVILLAAGRGKRMGTVKPKVLRKLVSKPIIFWALDLLRELNLLRKTVVAVGYRAKFVINTIRKAGYEVKRFRKVELWGTGHAVKGCLKDISSTVNNVLVIFGDDSGLYSQKTIADFIRFHEKEGGVLSLLSVDRMERALGGLRRDEKGQVVGISDADELKSRGVDVVEVVCGAFCFKVDWLRENIGKIGKNPYSGEYSLPQLILIAAKQKRYARVFKLLNANEWVSVNRPNEYAKAVRLKKKMLAGNAN